MNYSIDIDSDYSGEGGDVRAYSFLLIGGRGYILLYYDGDDGLELNYDAEIDDDDIVLWRDIRKHLTDLYDFGDGYRPGDDDTVFDIPVEYISQKYVDMLVAEYEMVYQYALEESEKWKLEEEEHDC
ncbi:hypothetical protein HED60_19475 [Planctomycetales bacterium ZRK34]|nr:hypothetical protein HED60_19475 [Planctomycetales bacterium ZRK34]